MAPVVKKTLVTLVKVAVLGGILWWAYTKMPLNDQLAARTGEAVTLASPDGAPVALAAKERLTLVAPPPAPDGAYEARTPDGRTVRIPAAQVNPENGQLIYLPGVRTLVDRINWSRIALALAVLGPTIFLLGVRWQLLLVGSGVHVPFWTTIRLNYLGLFFNTFMPGGTGGDIIKAVAISRYTHRKAEAATMVLVDRIVGLIGLMLLAAAMVPFNYQQLAGVGQQVALILVVLAVGSVLFYSAAFRRLVRWDAILARLPGSAVLARIDAAVYDLRHRKGVLFGTMGLTVGLQALGAYAVYQAGLAIGITRADFGQYLIFVPMGYLVNAIPISFGGLGLMEGAYAKLFSDAHLADFAQGFMLGLLVRLMALAWSLPGGLFALTGTGRQQLREAEQADAAPAGASS